LVDLPIFFAQFYWKQALSPNLFLTSW